MADTRPWGLTDFQVFFNRENAEKGNSKEFQAVIDALGDYSMLQGKTVSLESAMDVVEANGKLLEACENYAKARKGALTSKGERRLDAVTRLAEYQRGLNLDELRDLKVVRQHEGKTWGEVGKISVAEITVDGKGEIVGANVSQRMKVELDGRTGFFTSERVLMGPDKAVDELIASEVNPVRRQILTDSQVFLKRVMRTNFLSFKEYNDMTPEERDMNDSAIPLGNEKKEWHADLKREIAKRVDALDSRIQSGELGIFERRKAMKERNALESLSRDEGLIHTFVNEYGRLDAEKTGRHNARLEADKGHKLVSHNIATSRVAELLGIGNIVAHSEKMIVHQGDQVMTGCFMDFAEGKDILSNDYATQRAFDQVEFTPNPSMNRDMANLEVFDFLCGQGDRHTGNMFYKLSEPDENGKRNIVGLQGIDNDLAFGDHNKDNFLLGRQRIDSMYFIDKDLADKVRGLDRKKLEYALGDLLTKEQIDAMEQRVNKFQERLEKDMVEIGPDGWNLDKYNEADYSTNLETSGLDKDGKNYVRGLRDMKMDMKAVMADVRDHKYGQILGAVDKSNNKFRASEQVQEDLYSDMHSMFEASEEKAAEYDQVMREKAAEHDKAVRMKAEETAARTERLRAKAEEIRARVEREKTGQSRTESQKTSPEKAATEKTAAEKTTAEKISAAKSEQPKRERVGFADLEGKKTPRTPRKAGMAIGTHKERQMENTAEKGKMAGPGMRR